MLIAYIVAYLDRVNVGFAKLQMLSDLHFSEATYGIGAGIFFVGYFLFGVPSNLILVRLGARRWISVLMISWGVTSGAMMWVDSLLSYFALRFLLGVAEAGFFPGIIFYLTQWFPAARRGKVVALFMSAIAICSVIGSVLSGWIMLLFAGSHGWAGWQWLFLLEATPAIIIGLVILLRARDDAHGVTWLSGHEKYLLAADLARDDAPKVDGALHEVFGDRRVWLACCIYFCAMMGLYGISFWLPTIVSEMGIKGTLQIGLVTAIPYSIAGIGMVLVGRSAHRHDERRWHVAVPGAIGASGLILSVMLSADPVIAVAALSLAAFGVLTVAPLFWVLPIHNRQKGAAAASIAFINSFGCLAGFVSPYVVGWLKNLTHTTAAGMSLVAVAMLVGAVLVIVGIPSARVTNRR